MRKRAEVHDSLPEGPLLKGGCYGYKNNNR
jgi:hypothetical protein